MSTPLRKTLVGAGFATLLVLGYIFSLYYRAYQKDAPLLSQLEQIEKNQEAYFAMMAADNAKWDALEARDTYGGKTPEETWGMYIDALKKGDVELASKYYQVDQQNEVKDDLEIAKKNNVLPRLIKIGLLKMRTTCESGSTSCELMTESFDESEMGVTFFFRKNKQTHIWKIYDPTKNHQQ
jgi:hypothetical protein